MLISRTRDNGPSSTNQVQDGKGSTQRLEAAEAKPLALILDKQFCQRPASLRDGVVSIHQELPNRRRKVSIRSTLLFSRFFNVKTQPRCGTIGQAVNLSAASGGSSGCAKTASS